LLAGCPLNVLIAGFADLGAEQAERLAAAARQHGTKLLLVLSDGQEEVLDLAVGVPCNGFLIQDELTVEALDLAFFRLAKGDIPMPALLADRLLRRARAGELRARSRGDVLTPRERQVLELLVEGMSNKQIALRLRISQHGVKRLVSNVLAKLNCPNRTMAVRTAITDGILSQA
jgi:DNA-binding NarL/FixJ family response regulator